MKGQKKCLGIRKEKINNISRYFEERRGQRGKKIK
jgi:hypothetical protein